MRVLDLVPAQRQTGNINSGEDAQKEQRCGAAKLLHSILADDDDQRHSKRGGEQD